MPWEGPCGCDRYLTCPRFVTTPQYIPRLQGRLRTQERPDELDEETPADG